MSVYALKPNFSDKEGYKEWRKSWKNAYAYISQAIRRRKHEMKAAQRAGDPAAAKHQRELLLMKSDARKMMTLMDDAKALRGRIIEMHKALAEQNASFPLTFDARVADFHFNKVVLQFPFMPKWVLKANGKTFYVEHLDAQMGFSTRELEKGSTLGMLRFRKCRITLDKDGVSTMTEQPALELAA